nr:MAG TPA: hypothetical protein [Bacteriophage sp.]
MENCATSTKEKIRRATPVSAPPKSKLENPA